MLLKQFGVAVFITVIVSLGPLQAQKRRASAPDLPGTLTFSCTSIDFANINCDDVAPAITRIIGDASNYPGIGAPEGGQGAFLRGSDKNIWVGIGAGQYKLLIDFSERLEGDVPVCSFYDRCRLTESRFANYRMLVDVEDGEIQGAVLDGPGGTALADGLLAIAVGGEGIARLKINFADPIDGSLWGIRFNSVEYPGSHELPVSRTDECTWTFDARGRDTNGDGIVDEQPLAGVPGTMDKKTKIRMDEGLFVLRFAMTLRIPGLCQANP